MRKNKIIKIIKFALTATLMLTVCPQLFAAPPPPPGVPLDAGISLLVVAAVGYGANKIIKEKNDV
jgi:hypothetical protein